MARPTSPSETSDPYDLQRFVDAQSRCYADAVAELRAGAKATHWMWFVFPQLRGLGSSAMSERFGIGSKAEAMAYLEHPILGERLRECVELVLAVNGRTARQIFGTPDDLKLHSSMTLFACAAPTERLFAATIDKYYGGELEQRTLVRLK